MIGRPLPMAGNTEQVALVLGAIKGIGKGIALDLAGRGFKVALTYHDWPEALPCLQADCAAFGDQCGLFNVDLCDCDAVPPLIDAVLSRFGRLDILVNNIERGGWPVRCAPPPPRWKTGLPHSRCHSL